MQTTRTMHSWRRLGTLVSITVAVAVAACAVAVAQQVKKTKSAEISASTMEYNWNANTFEFAGNCHLEIKGAYEATMTAPKMNAKLGKKGDRVEHLTASGPVHFEVTTEKDANGVRRKIVASSQGSATYEESTQKVTLDGGAVADVTTLPTTPESEAAHFEGDRIVADLGASNIHVEKAHVTVTGTPEKQ